MPKNATTRDGNLDKRLRLVAAFLDPANTGKSDRELAEVAEVSSYMVRRWRDILGVPKRQPHTGLPTPGRTQWNPAKAKAFVAARRKPS